MTHYSWQPVFERLQEKGPQRIVTIFKLGLKEMPRLEGAFLGPNPEDHKKAKEEIVALFHCIDIEMQQAISESNFSPAEFIQQVKKAANFTPEEWGQLSRVPELIGQHHSELFAKRAFNTPKKRNPFFKV